MGERKQFEYLRKGYEYANELGQQGWEAVGVFSNTGSILFKRELIQEPETAPQANFTAEPVVDNWEWIECRIDSRYRHVPADETLAHIRKRWPGLKVKDLGGWKDYSAINREITMNVKVAK